MGVIYKMQCERCNTAFEHQAGIGLCCTCRDCGEQNDESAPFFCPVCNKRYQPESDEFNDSLREVILWD